MASLDEGDGWVNWSELATLLAGLERSRISPTNRLLTFTKLVTNLPQ